MSIEQQFGKIENYLKKNNIFNKKYFSPRELKDISRFTTVAQINVMYYLRYCR